MALWYLVGIGLTVATCSAASGQSRQKYRYPIRPMNFQQTYTRSGWRPSSAGPGQLAKAFKIRSYDLVEEPSVSKKIYRATATPLESNQTSGKSVNLKTLRPFFPHPLSSRLIISGLGDVSLIRKGDYVSVMGTPKLRPPRLVINSGFRLQVFVIEKPPAELGNRDYTKHRKFTSLYGDFLTEASQKPAPNEGEEYWVVGQVVNTDPLLVRAKGKTIRLEISETADMTDGPRYYILGANLQKHVGKKVIATLVPHSSGGTSSVIKNQLIEVDPVTGRKTKIGGPFYTRSSGGTSEYTLKQLYLDLKTISAKDLGRSKD